jgi:uncharacterized protein
MDLVDRALDRLLAHDMAGFANLWAEDGVLEFPFASPGYPARSGSTGPTARRHSRTR